MPSEPTIEVKLDPCPDCEGKGSKPPRVETDGQSRSLESGGSCTRCEGQGNIIRDVPLSELGSLIERPHEFR
jgi:DnaJ-class molecular chaperone